MSIQKITKEELLQNGIKSLPARPSSPSLYSGNILSADELKAAFDKLPTLIAERFNDLLCSTGLFDDEHPADTFAELIATNLSASHSLKDFFEDVKNGNLALYLTANAEGKSLSDVISDLWRTIESKKSYTVSIEGDGDLLSDASFENEHLTLKREGRSQEIVKLANDYTDAPVGSVTEDCTLPVSGKTVFHAIEKESEKQGKRIETLENAANGILYTYPIKEESFAYKSIEGEELPNTALLAIGAAPIRSVNLFPEGSLDAFSNGHLTITWDESTKELVFNGTFRTEDSPLRLNSFIRDFPYHNYFTLATFYHGGTVSAENAKFCTISNGDDLVSIPLLNEDSWDYGYFEIGSSFSYTQLTTKKDVVFDNYRINILVARAQTLPTYEPFQSRFRFKMPKALVSIGPNHWRGEEKLTGEKFVSFRPPCKDGPGWYLFGMRINSTYIDSTTSSVQIYSGDTLLEKERVTTSGFRHFLIESELPITEVRVYAANTEEKSEGHTVTVSDIYVQPVPPNYDKDPVYMKAHKEEILFPDSLSRLAEYYVGAGRNVSDFIDLKSASLTSSLKFITVDGSPDFALEEGYSNRFSAPFVAPTALQNSKEYYISDFFYALTTLFYAERLWFTTDRIYIQSALFEGKDASFVKTFLNRYPVDVAYKGSTKKHPLTAEEKEALTDLTIRILPEGYLYFRDENDCPIETYAKIQYQVKQTTEVTQ